MQAFPPPREESEEFYLSGVARLIEDPAIRQMVLADAKHIAHESEVLFEFLIDRAMHTTWENWGHRISSRSHNLESFQTLKN